MICHISWCSLCSVDRTDMAGFPLQCGLNRYGGMLCGVDWADMAGFHLQCGRRKCRPTTANMFTVSTSSGNWITAHPDGRSSMAAYTISLIHGRFIMDSMHSQIELENSRTIFSIAIWLLRSVDAILYNYNLLSNIILIKGILNHRIWFIMFDSLSWLLISLLVHHKI